MVDADDNAVARTVMTAIVDSIDGQPGVVALTALVNALADVIVGITGDDTERRTVTAEVVTVLQGAVQKRGALKTVPPAA